MTVSPGLACTEMWTTTTSARLRWRTWKLALTDTTAVILCPITALRQVPSGMY